MSTADAVDREVAWLTTVDALPSLLKANGGAWDVVQGYWPRTMNARQSGIYLLRRSIAETRFANARKIDSYEFHAKLWWPIGASTTSVDIWEAEQRAFDVAVDAFLGRLRGAVFDHTHGGRFLSVAETPHDGRISVHFDDPERTASASPACLRADVLYPADDRDFTA